MRYREATRHRKKPLLPVLLMGRLATGIQISHRGGADTQHIDPADIERFRRLDSTPQNIRLAGAAANPVQTLPGRVLAHLPASHAAYSYLQVPTGERSNEHRRSRRCRRKTY
jgi:hypothetical protein